MKDLQKVPATIQELKYSYDKLYMGWMGTHKNYKQANLMLNLLSVKQGKSLLDIGCGMGHLIEIATEIGVNSFGIDLSMVALKKAGHEKRIKPHLVQGIAETLPFPNFHFDYVTILGSLEHFLNPGKSIQEVRRVLRSNGKAAILVPNSHHIRAIYNVYKYGEILSDDQEFERFATRKEWENLLVSNGLSITGVYKFDTGMARSHRKGRLIFWYLYNILFRLFSNFWIPLNLTYTFIFICEPQVDTSV